MSAVLSTSLDAGTLYRQHALFVRHFLRRLGVSDGQLDDCVQDVFAVAHRRGGYAPGPATARSWLGAITVRIAGASRRAWCKRSSREPADAVDVDERPCGRSLDRLLEARESMQVLERLHDVQREAFLLFALCGQSCEEIALEQGVPVGTIYSRLSSARKTMISALNDRV